MRPTKRSDADSSELEKKRQSIEKKKEELVCLRVLKYNNIFLYLIVVLLGVLFKCRNHLSYFHISDVTGISLFIPCKESMGLYYIVPDLVSSTDNCS